MNKLALFVEGQTEAQFLERLVSEIIGHQNVTILRQKKYRGSKFITLYLRGDDDSDYFVLIRDCMNDGSVKSAILDTWESLKESDYEIVLGLRDVYPIEISDALKLKTGLNENLPDEIYIKILLAIHEIEAWFIAENSHFERIDPRLTKTFIENGLPIDISPNTVEDIEHPANVLNQIYCLVGKKYDKREHTLPHTIYNLDCAQIYLNLPASVSCLDELISELDQFIQN